VVLFAPNLNWDPYFLAVVVVIVLLLSSIVFLFFSLSKLTKEMDGNKFFLVTNSKPPYAFSDLPTKSKVSN